MFHERREARSFLTGGNGREGRDADAGRCVGDAGAEVLRLGTKRIAAELGCSRNTVKRWLAEGGWRSASPPWRTRALEGFESWLAERFRRHGGNADVVRQELAAEHGITVSLRTVERAVAQGGSS